MPEGLSGYQVKSSELSPHDCKKRTPSRKETRSLFEAGGYENFRRWSELFPQHHPNLTGDPDSGELGNG